MGKTTRKSQEEIEQFFNREGYKLLEPYTNANTKMMVACPEGHQYPTKYSVFYVGKRCPHCYGNVKKTESEYRPFLESKGLNYVSNNGSRLTIGCSEGHIYTTTYGVVSRGYQCPECSRIKRQYTLDFVRETVESEGYKLLSSDYHGRRKKIELECPQGHKYGVLFNNFLNMGVRCPTCFYESGTSRSEKQLTEYVRTVCSHDIVENDRSQIINPKTGRFLELDVWIPSTHKAIEFNGERWHTKEKDELKESLCRMKSIDLLTVTYTDWKNNEDIVKERVRSFVN